MPAITTVPSTLPAALRAGTAERHARTESLVPILDPALTLAGYAAILARFHLAYAPLEAALARVPAWPAGFDLTPRRKRALLERDLAWLRSRGVVASVPARDGVEAAPAAPTLPAALGMLYVLEGATLGGQVILRHVAPRLGVGPDAGASFYAGYGAETGRMWRAFGTMLDAWGCANRHAWPEVLASAQATFDAIAAPFEVS
jgi:heme oxygenase